MQQFLPFGNSLSMSLSNAQPADFGCEEACITKTVNNSLVKRKKQSRFHLTAFAILFLNLFFVSNIFAQTTQTFTPGVGQTFTVPAGVTSVTVKAWGGGGSANNSTAPKAGGGGGGYSEKTFTVASGQTINIAVGAAGTPSSTAGGNTTVTHAASSTSMTANGGGGGIAGTAGTGGTASGGSINNTGGAGV